MDPAALEPVDERAAESRSFLPEGGDCLSYLDRRFQVLLDQRGEPCRVLFRHFHSPGQGILLDLRHSLTLCERAPESQAKERRRLAVSTCCHYGLTTPSLRETASWPQAPSISRPL